MRWLIPFTFFVLASPTYAEQVTYNKHVAPILFKHCADCHRPGEVGPFSLLNYKDAAKRADFLVEVTSSRQMPPWKAEPNFGTFHNERRLTEVELRTLAEWTKAGAPEGDPRDLPPLPTFTTGWALGEPDMILKMPTAFRVPASGRDVLQCFPLPIPAEAKSSVEAVEFRPGNRSVVHHAILYLDSTGAARKKDAATPEPGYRTFGGPGFVPSGSLGAWTPGAAPQRLTEGIAKYLKPGSDLVLQIHYHPNGKEETDQSQVGIYFSKKPVEKYVGGIGIRGRFLIIPANSKRQHVQGETPPLPTDVYAIGITPHMHNIGKEIKVIAHTPDGKDIPLIWIKDWDFNWQGTYPYASPVKIPKGSILKLDAYYDNSTDNPRNPSNPPKMVRWGEQTTDEMCLCGVQVITDTPADLRKIMSMPGARLGQLLGASVPESTEDNSSVPEGGVTIPEKFRRFLGIYDKNKDGKLDTVEIDAMPAELRKRVYEYIRDNKPS